MHSSIDNTLSSPGSVHVTMSFRRIAAFAVLLGSLYFAATMRDGHLGFLSPVFIILAVVVAIMALAVVLFDLRWSRRDAPRFVTQPRLKACPACGSNLIVDGRIYTDRGEEGDAEHFFPHGIGFFSLRQSVSLNGRHPFRGCASCGHLWSTFNPDELRQLIESKGLPELQARIAKSN